MTFEEYLIEKRINYCALTSQQMRNAEDDDRIIKCKKSFHQVIEMTRNENAYKDLSAGLYELGMLLNLEGKFHEASQRLRESLNILEQIPELDSQGISGCYFQLGISALYQENFADAIQNLEQSLKIDTENKDINGIKVCEMALEKCKAMQMQKDRRTNHNEK